MTVRILEEPTAAPRMPDKIQDEMARLSKEGFKTVGYAVVSINREGSEHLLYSVVMEKVEMPEYIRKSLEGQR